MASLLSTSLYTIVQNLSIGILNIFKLFSLCFFCFHLHYRTFRCYLSIISILFGLCIILRGSFCPYCPYCLFCPSTRLYCFCIMMSQKLMQRNLFMNCRFENACVHAGLPAGRLIWNAAYNNQPSSGICSPRTASFILPPAFPQFLPSQVLFPLHAA